MSFGEIAETFIDHLPIRWTFVFHMSVIAAIVLVLWQIKTADILNDIRWNGMNALLLNARRATMGLKLAALCWAVLYSHANDWAPWPPIVAFIAAFDVHVLLDIYLMHRDIDRLRERLAAGMT